MVKIRLQRVGKRNRPHYRLVVIESREAVGGKVLANVGSYDPLKKVIHINLPEVERWISLGAQLTPRAKALIKLYTKSTEVVKS